MFTEVNYLENIVSPLIVKIDDMTIKRTVDNRGVLLELNVNPSDMGFVIGKQGETAFAIRRLLRQYGMCHEMRLSMRLNEPEGGKRFPVTESV